MPCHPYALSPKCPFTHTHPISRVCCTQMGAEAMSLKNAMSSLKVQADNLAAKAQADVAAAATARIAADAELSRVMEELKAEQGKVGC